MPEVVLEDELLKTLRSGATATFIVFQSPEEGIGIPVDLEGFRRGLRRASGKSTGLALSSSGNLHRL